MAEVSRGKGWLGSGVGTGSGDGVGWGAGLGVGRGVGDVGVEGAVGGGVGEGLMLMCILRDSIFFLLLLIFSLRLVAIVSAIWALFLVSSEETFNVVKVA